jgi:hypothetical protein
MLTSTIRSNSGKKYVHKSFEFQNFYNYKVETRNATHILFSSHILRRIFSVSTAGNEINENPNSKDKIRG